MSLWKDLIFYDRQGAISHTKFWSNVGYFLMCIAFSVINANMLIKFSSFNARDWVEIFVAFGSLVAIPNGFSKWLSYKSTIAEKSLDVKAKSLESCKDAPDGAKSTNGG